MTRINGYDVPACESTSVGDWQGQEDRAARQFEAVCEEIAKRLPPPAWDHTQERYEELCATAWDLLGSDADLLTGVPAQLANRVVKADA
jgi:hypothetical protein